MRAREEALLVERADRPGGRIAEAGPELLVAPFDAGGDVDPVRDGVRDVGVEVDLPLPVGAEVERGRRVSEPREALTVSKLDRAASWTPSEPLTSQPKPPAPPRTPPTMAVSVAVPPIRGV